MKHLIVIAALLTFSSASAQTEKGNCFINLQVGFNSNSNSTDYPSNTNPEVYKYKYQSLNLNLGFAYFIKNNLALGIGPMLSCSKSENSQSNTITNVKSQENKNTNSSLAVLIFLRKYIPLNDQFSLYGQLQAGGGPTNSTYSYKNSNSAQDSKTTGSSLQAGIGMGVAWFPSKKVGVHVGIGNIGWNSNNSDTKDINNQSTSSKSNNFNFNFNTLTLQFGLSYFLLKSE